MPSETPVYRPAPAQLEAALICSSITSPPDAPYSLMGITNQLRVPGHAPVGTHGLFGKTPVMVYLQFRRIHPRGKHRLSVEYEQPDQTRSVLLNHPEIFDEAEDWAVLTFRWIVSLAPGTHVLHITVDDVLMAAVPLQLQYELD